VCATPLPAIEAQLPPEFEAGNRCFDQSIFVRGGPWMGVLKEGADRGGADGPVMILIFLGSWRSTPDRRHLDTAFRSWRRSSSWAGWAHSLKHP